MCSSSVSIEGFVLTLLWAKSQPLTLFSISGIQALYVIKAHLKVSLITLIMVKRSFLRRLHGQPTLHYIIISCSR